MQNKKYTIYFSSYDDINNPYYGGGGAVAVHEVAKRLSKKYDVRVICWNYSGKKNEVIDNVYYERFGFPALNHKIAMLIYQLSLPFIIMNRQYDVWMESFCPPFTTAFLPLFTIKPVVGIVHMLAAGDMERKYKLPFHIVQNNGLKTYKHIIATSELLKKKIDAMHPLGSVSVISNGITKIYKPVLQKEKYILFLGRIEMDQKGIDLLIDAFKQFHLNNKEYKLIIAGNGDPNEVAKMRVMINAAGIAKDVILKGRVKGKTKEILFHNAACVVISSRFETYSLVALEAMAHGTPIVYFAIEGLSWIPKNAAKKVPAYDTTRLAKAIAVTVSDQQVTHSLMKTANAYAKQFTWDAIAKEYDEYLKQLVSNNE